MKYNMIADTVAVQYLLDETTNDIQMIPVEESEDFQPFMKRKYKR